MYVTNHFFICYLEKITWFKFDASVEGILEATAEAEPLETMTIGCLTEGLV